MLWCADNIYSPLFPPILCVIDVKFPADVLFRIKLGGSRKLSGLQGAGLYGVRNTLQLDRGSNGYQQSQHTDKHSSTEDSARMMCVSLPPPDSMSPVSSAAGLLRSSLHVVSFQPTPPLQTYEYAYTPRVLSNHIDWQTTAHSWRSYRLLTTLTPSQILQTTIPKYRMSQSHCRYSNHCKSLS